MTQESLEALKLTQNDGFNVFHLLDQRELPLKTTYIEIKSVEEAWIAIKDMAVRGAPAIAIAGALALASELHNNGAGSQFGTAEEAQEVITQKLDYLVTSRPTAVNLSDAAEKLKKVAHSESLESDATSSKVVQKVIKLAKEMQKEDVASNQAMGKIGAEAILKEVRERKDSSQEKLNILTHCNTGSLATAGYGTALGVVRALHAQGHIKHVYCTETRPYNQGARLTAYELVHDGIDATLIADSAAAALMEAGRVDAIVVGADRVSANGDTANKIGTYSLAVNASHHEVPFYIAAPTTTLDVNISSGKDIKIEERDSKELTHHQGKQVAAPGIQVWNPSFDVTPARIITGIITEKGLISKGQNPEFSVPEFLSKFDSAKDSLQNHTDSTGSKIPGFYALNTDSVKDYLRDRPELCDRVGSKESAQDWQVEEVGDGNINYVYIVEGPRGALVVKQGLPYIRIDHSWNLTQERARIEANALKEQNKHCPKHVPTVYHFDPNMALIVMQYLAPPHIILRKALVAGKVFPQLSTHVADFLAKTLFNTSLYNLDTETYRKNLEIFANPDLCKLTEQVIFTDPYYGAPVNRHTSPELDKWADFMLKNQEARKIAGQLKKQFIEKQEALLHGDLHTGSFMVTEETTYAIDAEFAYYGPMAFDVQKMIANLLIAYFASFGLGKESQNENENRDNQRKWLLQSAKEIWILFTQKFADLCQHAVQSGKRGPSFSKLIDSSSGTGIHDNQIKERLRIEVYPELLNDALRIAGAVIIRRILGIAHVIDFESISNKHERAICEGKALHLGYKLLTNPPKLITDVIELAENLIDLDPGSALLPPK